MKTIQRLAFLLVVIGLLVSPAFAGQTQIPNYRTAWDKFFYEKLHPKGGFTLYCGVRGQERAQF